MKQMIALTMLSIASYGVSCAIENFNMDAGLPIAVPEEVGLSASRLKRINPIMRKYVDEEKFAGIITMVARRGKVVHFECAGMMYKEAGKSMMPDTIFRIYSMTKPITSVAIMMLYEEGRFQLNDPVSKFIPEFRDLKVSAKKAESGVELADVEHEMTILNLLTHTSGLTYNFPDSKTLKEMIRKLGKHHLASQPGSQWCYSVSTDVLGYLVEVISGKPFDVFLKERIFDPLGMVDTGFYVPKEKLHRLSANYIPGKDRKIQLHDDPAKSVYSRPVTFFSGGAGLVSTTADYIRFSQMLLNKGELDGVRLLGRKTVELMTMNHLPEGMHPFGDQARGFGLGFYVVLDVAKSGKLGTVGSFGWGGVAGSIRKERTA